MFRRKEVSGRDFLELSLALEYMRRWRDVLDKESDVAPNETAEEGVVDVVAVDRFISRMEERLQTAKSIGFSSADNPLLQSMGITQAGHLASKGTDKEKIRHVREQDAPHGMSQSNLYGTLNLLLQHTIARSEALSRLWIDAFLCRVIAMTRGTTRLVMGMEAFAPPEIVVEQPRRVQLGGLLDYVIFLVDEDVAGMVMTSLNLAEAITQAKRRQMHGLFVAEAKSQEQPLSAYIPQVVTEMFICAKRMGSRYIRGALTSGREWIFVLLELNADKKGGQYWRSDVPRKVKEYDESDELSVGATVNESDVDVIVAILKDWITRCAENITDDDWFRLVS
ncbi:hypothetical protein GY45DRAFT_1331294 [Cubamyces sp. BRFM 1775]|nr:hypothetical protein GY45DRAFT_1331294 [Cubamyces sp. BRFM 1775]